MSEPKIDKHISVNCYDEHGVTIIRISTESRDKLIEIRNIIQKLADRNYDRVDFQDIEGAIFSNINGLTLRLVNSRKEPSKHVKRVTERNSDSPYFYWSRNSEGWQDCVFWLDGLIQSNLAGHQYLSEENDIALIVVAYHEGS
jgi:hypothetical protein